MLVVGFVSKCALVSQIQILRGSEEGRGVDTSWCQISYALYFLIHIYSEINDRAIG